MDYKRFGFTLAEVLITLGIIGMVAAMTIPTLMQKNYERKTVTQLKETYSIINQAIRLSSEENGMPEEWGINPEERDEASAKLIAEKLKPYLKIAVDCGVSNENSACISSAKYKYLNNTIEPDTTLAYTRYRLSLINGATIMLEGGQTYATMFVKVDTNGRAKPNAWGKDLFEFSYMEGKGLLPSGNPQVSANTYKNNCYNNSHKGWGCAYYVLHFGNMDYLRRKAPTE